MGLVVERCTINEARMGVAVTHRHLPNVLGGIIALVVRHKSGGQVCGYAIIGRPSSRRLQEDGWVELTRCATDGTRNACSALYGAAARWARREGHRIITYTLPHEGGASLRGAGWVAVGQTRDQKWARGDRADRATPNLGSKWRWTPPRDAAHAPARGRFKTPTAHPEATSG